MQTIPDCELQAAQKRLDEICGEHVDLVYIIVGAHEFIAVINAHAAARKRGFGKKSLRKLADKIGVEFMVYQTID